MGTPLRVLLVEDSEDDALLLLHQLRSGGYEPSHERVETPEAMEAALDGAAWDVVIADYRLPAFSAPAALEMLRGKGLDLPFIMVSGKVGEEAAVETMRAGARDYVNKGNLARLNPAIERELREAGIRRERRRSEERFRRVMNHAADALFVHDLDGKLVDVNRRACESLGYTREELLEMSVPDIEMSFTGSLQKLWGEMTPGAPLTVEGVHRRKDGTTFPVEVRVGVFDSEGKPLMIALARDIGERKLAETRLKEAEQRYRTLVESLPVATYVQDPKTNTLSYLSPQFEEVMGYAPEEYLADPGLRPRTIHPEDRERVLAENRRTDLTGEPFVVEYRRIRRDGRVIWVRDEAVLVRDPGGRPLFWQGVFSDITERKRAEEEIRRLNEKLEERVRQRTAELTASNKELEAFSYSVSHDLRAPLRSIDGFSQILLEDHAERLDEEGRDYLRRMRAASERMGQLINATLGLSRLTRAEMRRERVDLSALARSVAEELQNSRPERRVEVVIEQGLTAEGDRSLLRVLLENLLGNAWKFTGEETRPRIEFGITQDGGTPTYYVKDNGVGFEEAHAHKLFGAFQRLHTEEQFEGTGIGLATVARIVHRHGGRISAEGEVGKGATFYFTL